MNAAVKPGPFVHVDRFAQRPTAEPCHDARTLTGQGTRAVIVLDGQTYYLRITRAGKLILTK